MRSSPISRSCRVGKGGRAVRFVHDAGAVAPTRPGQFGGHGGTNTVPIPPMSRPPLPVLRIDGARLWGELMETATIGATRKGGICRLTLTDLDRQVRDWFKARAEGLGCTVTVDSMGAMF